MAADAGRFATRGVAVAGAASQAGIGRGTVVVLVAGCAQMAVLAIILGNNFSVADTAFNHGLFGDIVVTGGRLALMAGMAVLLEGCVGMAVLADFAVGGGSGMVPGAGIAVNSPVLGVVT